MKPTGYSTMAKDIRSRRIALGWGVYECAENLRIKVEVLRAWELGERPVVWTTELETVFREAERERSAE